MDEPVEYVITDRAALLTSRMRVSELEAMLRHIDHHSLDLLLYANAVEGTPDGAEWRNVLDMIREVRDGYGLRTPDR